MTVLDHLISLESPKRIQKSRESTISGFQASCKRPKACLFRRFITKSWVYVAGLFELLSATPSTVTHHVPCNVLLGPRHHGSSVSRSSCWAGFCWTALRNPISGAFFAGIDVQKPHTSHYVTESAPGTDGQVSWAEIFYPLKKLMAETCLGSLLQHYSQENWNWSLGKSDANECQYIVRVLLPIICSCCYGCLLNTPTRCSLNDRNMAS